MFLILKKRFFNYLKEVLTQFTKRFGILVEDVAKEVEGSSK